MASDGNSARADSVVDFYDGLAADYHLVYGDQWDEAIKSQGAVLERLIRAHAPNAIDVLDCSAGIGTQAIALATRGYQVHGSDISARSLERLEIEATRLGAQLTTAVADFRDLSAVPGDYDVVLACDNALPHLLSDEEVAQALASMRSKLRPRGLLLLSVRDYDQSDRPSLGATLLVAGPPRRVVIRLHDWDSPESPCYTVRFLVLTEDGSTWTTEEHSTRYRAISRETLTGLAVAAGFTDATWHDEDDFHQPLLTARRDEFSAPF